MTGERICTNAVEAGLLHWVVYSGRILQIDCFGQNGRFRSFRGVRSEYKGTYLFGGTKVGIDFGLVTDGS